MNKNCVVLWVNRQCQNREYQFGLFSTSFDNVFYYKYNHVMYGQLKKRTYMCSDCSSSTVTLGISILFIFSSRQITLVSIFLL